VWLCSRRRDLGRSLRGVNIEGHCKNNTQRYRLHFLAWKVELVRNSLEEWEGRRGEVKKAFEAAKENFGKG
jgi:hypothetical protein